MPPKERARYQVVIAGVFVAASVAGPLLGGFFAQHLHWSLIFWINLPIGFLAFALTNAKLKLLPRNERRHRLDYPGAILLILSSTSLMLALSWGGVRYPWGSAPVLGLLALAAVLGGLFAARLATAAEPLIPIEVLKDGCLQRHPVRLLRDGHLHRPDHLRADLPRGRDRLTASESGVALVPLMVGTVTGRRCRAGRCCCSGTTSACRSP